MLSYTVRKWTCKYILYFLGFILHKRRNTKNILIFYPFRIFVAFKHAYAYLEKKIQFKKVSEKSHYSRYFTLKIFWNKFVSMLLCFGVINALKCVVICFENSLNSEIFFFSSQKDFYSRLLKLNIVKGINKQLQFLFKFFEILVKTEKQFF